LRKELATEKGLLDASRLFARTQDLYEMVSPVVAPWVEQRNNLACYRVDCRQVRPLAKVTPMACERQVARIVRPAMLFGDDVFNAMGR
jgi:hypothetical protein